MRKLLSYFCCLIIVFNQITTSVNAANILQKTKIHKITNCESVLNSSFETYIDCLNEEIFSSKRFNRLSPNKKNDILSLLAIANILHENIKEIIAAKINNFSFDIYFNFLRLTSLFNKSALTR